MFLLLVLKGLCSPVDVAVIQTTSGKGSSVDPGKGFPFLIGGSGPLKCTARGHPPASGESKTCFVFSELALLNAGV